MPFVIHWDNLTSSSITINNHKGVDIEIRTFADQPSSSQDTTPEVVEEAAANVENQPTVDPTPSAKITANNAEGETISAAVVPPPLSPKQGQLSEPVPSKTEMSSERRPPRKRKLIASSPPPLIVMPRPPPVVLGQPSPAKRMRGRPRKVVVALPVTEKEAEEEDPDPDDPDWEADDDSAVAERMSADVTEVSRKKYCMN
jgi:hypothetical protein